MPLRLLLLLFLIPWLWMGFWESLVPIPHRVLNGPSHASLAPILCHDPSSGDFCPPPLVTLLATFLGTSVPDATLSCLVSSRDILATNVVSGVIGPTFSGVSIGILSPSFSPQVSTSNNPTLCVTSSISKNSSSDNSKVRYTLRNRSIIKEDFLAGGEDVHGGCRLGSFPRASMSGRG